MRTRRRVFHQRSGQTQSVHHWTAPSTCALFLKGGRRKEGKGVTCQYGGFTALRKVGFNSFSVATLRTDLLQLKVKKLMVQGWVLDTTVLKP